MTEIQTIRNPLDYLLRCGFSKDLLEKLEADESITPAELAARVSDAIATGDTAAVDELLEVLGTDTIRQRLEFTKEKPAFYIKGESGKPTFRHDIMAEYMIQRYNACRIGGALHIYDQLEGTYTSDISRIYGYMTSLERAIKKSQRGEVFAYMDTSLDLLEVNEAPANLIPFKDYIYDIETGASLCYTGEQIFLAKFPYNYNPSAERQQLIDDTINAIACNDSDTRQLILELFGYCFYRKNSMRGGVVFLVGAGQNGKSTLQNMLRQMLGEKNTSSLSVDDICGARACFRLADIKGKAANICDDIGDNFAPKTAELKELATGAAVTTERKGEHPEAIKPSAKFFFNANNMPRFKDNSEGFFSRLTIVPLKADFKKSGTKIIGLDSRTWSEAEMEYLTKISLEAFMQALERKSFTEPSAAKEMLAEFKTANNPFLAWYTEYNSRNGKPHDNIAARAVPTIYEDYKGWCEDNGYEAISRFKFSQSCCTTHGNLATTSRYAPDGAAGTIQYFTLKH